MKRDLFKVVFSILHKINQVTNIPHTKRSVTSISLENTQLKESYIKSYQLQVSQILSKE